MAEVIGFTTLNDKFETLTDKELAKHDLMLELFTNKGELDWEPDFGSIILDQIFQLKTNAIRDIIIEDIKRIVDKNGLISFVDLATQDIEGGWIFTLTVRYLNQLPEEWSFRLTDESVKEFISNGTYPLE